MDADSEYYNIYCKEPVAKVTIYTSILYFVIVIYESRGKVPTKYFVKRFYGVEDTCEIPQEEGKEGPVSDA